MKISKFLLSLTLLFISVYGFASYSGDGQLNNSAAIDADSNSKNYWHSHIAGDSIVFSHAEGLNYIADGVLRSFMFNPNIVWLDYSPKPGYVSPTVAVDVSLRVGTSSDKLKIRQVKYRINTSPDFPDSLQYTSLFDNDSSTQSLVFVESKVTFQKTGANYIQWYVQYKGNDGNTNTSGGATQIYVVNIAANAASRISIIQPKKVSSARPVIEAEVFSVHGNLKPGNLQIEIFNASTPNGSIYSKTANDIPAGSFSANTGILKYVYDGEKPLENNKEYKLKLTYEESGGNRIVSETVFRADSEPISNLLPYPSPYNPNKGDMTIRFMIDKQAFVTVNIYDRAGKLVSSVIDSVSKSAGENKVSWNGKSYSGDNLANGVYICEIIMKSGGKENKRYKSFAILRK